MPRPGKHLLIVTRERGSDLKDGIASRSLDGQGCYFVADWTGVGSSGPAKMRPPPATVRDEHRLLAFVPRGSSLELGLILAARRASCSRPTVGTRLHSLFSNAKTACRAGAASSGRWAAVMGSAVGSATHACCRHSWLPRAVGSNCGVEGRAHFLRPVGVDKRGPTS
jgi:hypothetical protein